MSHAKHFFAFICLSAALLACQPSAATPQTTALVNSPAPSATQPPPTLAATATHTALPTQTPSATPTPLPPTATRWPTFGPSPTLSAQEATSVLLKSSYPVWSVAWSPNGQTIAQGGDAGRMMLWNAVTQKPIANLWVHGAFVETLSFSPDSRWLVSGANDGVLILWNVSQARKVEVFEGHSQFIDRVSWSPDGQTLAVQRYPDPTNPRLMVWDTHTWQVQREIESAQRMFDLAWSPDGQRLVTGLAGGEIALWNPATGELEKKIKGHQANVLNVALSPDGRWLASRALDDELYIWDLNTEQVVQKLKVRPGIFSLAWAPDSQRLAYGSLNSPLRIINPSTGQFLYSFKVEALRGVAWSPDGTQLAAAVNTGVKVWQVGP